MIIHQRKRESLDKKGFLRFLLLLLAGLLFLAAVFYFFTKKKSGYDFKVSTSFEKKKKNGFYSNGQNLFEGGVQFQKTQTVKSGNKSLNIIPGKDTVRIAYTHIIPKGRYYGSASVWVHYQYKKPEVLIHTKSKDGSFARQAAKEVDWKDGWTQLELFFVSPKNDSTELIFHIEVFGEGAVNLDDFSIQFSTEYPEKKRYFGSTNINLRIEPEAMAKLQKKRDEAMDAGVLMSADDDWVNAKFIEGDKELDAKIRLKGDWISHLEGDKWSFRVKFKKDGTWRRMKTISLQSPEARTFVSEWVLHQFWKKEDILTTRYDFLTLSINGETRGIYAYEEHFEKQLLEFNNRREGPIVKYDEADIWDMRKRLISSLNYLPKGSMPTFEAEFLKAAPQSFGENKIAKSAVLSRHYAEAVTLLNQYQTRSKMPREIFNLDLFAKYYAICDIMDAHHATVWHNQRFYYNPVTNLLEPIGYDGNVEIMKLPLNFRGQHFFGDNEISDQTHVFANMARDTSFIRTYIEYLDQFSDKDYLQALFDDMSPDIWQRNEFLKAEFENPDFQLYNPKFQSKRIRANLFPFNDHSLKAYKGENNAQTKTIHLRNKHVTPMLILGTGISKKGMNHRFEKPYFMWANSYKPVIPKFHKIEVPKDAVYIYGQALGLDVVVHSKISPLPKPSKMTSSQEIFGGSKLDMDSDIYAVNEQHIVFRAGKHIISKDIIIPAGYMVIFEQGTHLDFINGAGFMSKSPVKMLGVEDAPVTILSSDNSAGGFTVLEAEEKSLVQHVIIKDFDTWKRKNWILTGAMTFYESDVEINRLAITGNVCEDGLNIIRSTFDIQQMIISNTFSDGFDADFCKGKIIDSRFLNTGNDGMDFSGSNIEINRCSVKNGGDKGLSVGEDSKVMAKELTIDGCVLGVASKDLSELKLINAVIKNCQQGFAAYRKKPEYGGATIISYGHKVDNVAKLHQIEAGSELTLGSTIIK